MGIINVTPDSFSNDGILNDIQKIQNTAKLFESLGPDIIDVGGESTRPKHIYQGAQSISVDEELERVLPLLEKLKNNLAIPISIDTQKGIVAKYGLQYGAKIINDGVASFSEKICSIFLIFIKFYFYLPNVLYIE